MHARSWILAGLTLLMTIPAPGCGLFRRRRGNETNVATNVSVAQTGRDVGTLTRDQYEVLDSTYGKSKATRWFILSFPIGGQTSADEVGDNAYYEAVGKVSGCDAMLMAHPNHRRVVVPLLLVNIVRYEASVRGRCIALKNDLQIDGKAPSTREATVVKPATEIEPAASREPPPADD